jgi:putative spermidine/putrescine transport system permease protein
MANQNETAQQLNKGAPKARPYFQNFSWSWVGVVPFFLFALLFIFIPTTALFVGSFQDIEGNFTLRNIQMLFTEDYIINSFMLTIRVSLVTAIGGAVFGFFLAYAVTIGGLPRWVRSFLSSFSGVASNFAGVPLAFAFIATLGRVGLFTVFLKKLGLDLYGTNSFSLYSFWGLSLTYMYFQFPLMVLTIIPALDGLKREWREACENLGASKFQYWWKIALPILMPSLLATTILLFGNAFGAYATAYALTGGTLNLVPIIIGAQIRGDVLNDPNLGYALALGMVIVMALALAIYYLLQKRASRWLR